MKLTPSNRHNEAAFTLIENAVALAILAIAITAFYGRVISHSKQVSREDVQADQILAERMESIRRRPWNQIVDAKSISGKFTNYYSPGSDHLEGKAIMYTGSVRIASAPATIPGGYSDNMRQVSVRVGWLSEKGLRQREISTFVSRYGSRNEVHSPGKTP